MAPFTSSRPVQTFATMSTRMKSEMAAAAFSVTGPMPLAGRVRLPASRNTVFFGSLVQTGLFS